MNKDFTLWLLENFRLIDGNLFYYKFDFQYVKTRFTYDELLLKFCNGKTKILS